MARIYKRTNNTYKQKGRRYNRSRRKPMIPKTIRFKSDEYHTTFLSTATVNTDASILNLDAGFNAKAKTFQLPDCVGINNWQRLFEEYRINRVVMSFTPVLTEMRNRAVGTTQVVGNVPLSTKTPFAYYVIDRNDDNVTGNNRETFKAKKGCVRKLATEPHVMSFRPTLLSAVYAGPAVPPDTTPLLNYNIDYDNNWQQNNQAAAGVNQPYWGVKYGIEAASPPGAYYLQVNIKYYVSFRKKIL